MKGKRHTTEQKIRILRAAATRRGAMASGRKPVHGLVGEDDEARSG